MRGRFFLTMLVIIAGATSVHAQSAYLNQTTIDHSVKPIDDFFSYENSGWLKANEIPNTEVLWGNGAIIRKQTRLRLQDIVREIAATENQNYFDHRTGYRII